MSRQVVNQPVTLRSAKFFVGQRLNVTLADCAILVNVKLKRIDKHGRLVFDSPRLPRLKLCEVSSLVPVSLAATSWGSSTLSQKVTSGPTDFNVWRRGRRCGASRCDRNRSGNRLLGAHKCARCSSLQEGSE
jgi:hypothetical protein